MAGMTDRVSDQTIIQLAKQQYESLKQQSMPSEIFPLVSNGMVYPKDHPLYDTTNKKVIGKFKDEVNG